MKSPFYLNVNGKYGLGAYEKPDFETLADLLSHLDRLGIWQTVAYHSNARDLHPVFGNRFLLEDIENTPGVKLVGPCGEVVIDKGVIVAKRHIHMTPADAEALGVSDKEIVKVKLDTARPVIFDDVVVRVSPKFALTMHIDTDECNAAAAFGACYGEIVK